MKRSGIFMTRSRNMSREGEQALLEQGPGLLDGRSLEVLKIAHHGSDSSTSEAWLDALAAHLAGRIRAALA